MNMIIEIHIVYFRRILWKVLQAIDYKWFSFQYAVDWIEILYIFWGIRNQITTHVDYVIFTYGSAQINQSTVNDKSYKCT